MSQPQHHPRRATPETGLRPFLASMAEDARPYHGPIPKVLTRIAASVSDQDSAEDLVSDLFLDLLRRRGQTGSVENLLALDDKALVSVLRRRLVQLRAYQFGSKSQLMRSIRDHVRAALAGGRQPVEVEAWPLSLMEGDRLSGHQVEHAAWYMMSHSDPPHRPDYREIASALFYRYFGDAEHQLAADTTPYDDAPLDPADASYFAQELRHRLGPELTRVLKLTAQGEPLRRICTSTTTAWDRRRRSLEIVRDFAHETGLSRADILPVIETVAA